MGEASRIMEELQEILSSGASEHGRERDQAGAECDPDGGVVGSPDSLFQGESFRRFHLNDDHDVGRIYVRMKQTGVETNAYCEKLRSRQSFPRAPCWPARGLSDVTGAASRYCADSDHMVLGRSLSDGSGGHIERKHQARGAEARRERELASAHQGATTSSSRGPPRTRRAYKCDVCGKIASSPQSLGGHKNLHRSKGKTHHLSSSRSRRTSSRGAPQQGVSDLGGHQMGGREVGSSSSSAESESACAEPPPTVAYKGVRCRDGDKWVTEIRPPRSPEKWWLGTFPSAEEAAQAYDVALAYFKADPELNFGHHPLYEQFPPLPPDLSAAEFAQRLREMVKDISDQIIAERHRLEADQIQVASHPSPPEPDASPAGSSSGTSAPAPDPPVRASPDIALLSAAPLPPPSSPADDYQWIDDVWNF